MALHTLGLHVLTKALVDCVHPTPVKYPSQRPEIQQDAKEFLFSPDRRDDVAAWCALAGINLEGFLLRAQYIFDHNIRILDMESTPSIEKTASPDPDEEGT